MKVKCISTESFTGYKYIHLTIDKMYNALESNIFPEHYWIMDDHNLPEYFYKKNFITISEIRKHQLNKLGI